MRLAISRCVLSNALPFECLEPMARIFGAVWMVL